MKKKLPIILILIYIFFCGYLFVSTRFLKNITGATPQDQISLKQKKQIKKMLNSFGFKGNAAFYKDGKRIWNYTTEGNINSAYLINSVQKAYTGAMVMQAVNEGKLSLDDKVAKFYPNVPNADNISILNLLEMTSGLSEEGSFGNNPFNNDDDNAQKTIQDMHFDDQSFNKWNYQDVNYVLLSHILEKATGRSYEDLFNEMYVYKLGLKHTDFLWADAQKIKEIGLIPSSTQVDMNEIHGLLGAGSVAMSNDDMFLSMSALLNGNILPMQSIQTIYGLGNNQAQYRGGLYTKDGYYQANGAGYNYSSFIRISKDGKSAVILQTNVNQYQGCNDNATTIYNMLFNQKNKEN